MMRNSGCFNIAFAFCCVKHTACDQMFTVSRVDSLVTSSYSGIAVGDGKLLSRTGMDERTIAAAVEFKGIGLHTGEPAALRILPAPPDKGIIFRRVDLDNF